MGCNSSWYGTMCDRKCPQKCESFCDRDRGCTDCTAGYFGSNCDQCSENTYGKNCSLTCQNCNNNCDPVNGCIICATGFYGANCQETCPEGCRDRKCDKNSGICLNGCIDRYMGDNCNRNCSIENCATCIISGSSDVSCASCNMGYYMNYTYSHCMKCPSNCITCENESKCTGCKPSFSGERCSDDCNKNCVDGLCEINGTCTYGCNNSKYGAGCSKNCSLNCMHCYNKYGCEKCLPGFYGSTCEGKCNDQCFNCTFYVCEVCKPGFYGSLCDGNCPSQCLTCDSEDFCTSCRDGWSGRLCQCSENCKNENCDDDGICQSECKDSYYRERCDVPCPSKDCLKCDQLSGNCTECSKGKHGINCTEKCSWSCLGRSCNMTGACLQGCEMGFVGRECTEIRKFKSRRYLIDLAMISLFNYTKKCAAFVNFGHFKHFFSQSCTNTLIFILQSDM